MFDWVKGTAIRPFLDTLDADECPAFEEACRARLRAVYAKPADGVTVFPFRRYVLLCDEGVS